MNAQIMYTYKVQDNTYCYKTKFIIILQNTTQFDEYLGVTVFHLFF